MFKVYTWITITGVLAVLGVLITAAGGLLDAPFAIHRAAGIATVIVGLLHACLVVYVKYWKPAHKK